MASATVHASLNFKRISFGRSGQIAYESPSGRLLFSIDDFSSYIMEKTYSNCFVKFTSDELNFNKDVDSVEKIKVDSTVLIESNCIQNWNKQFDGADEVPALNAVKEALESQIVNDPKAVYLLLSEKIPGRKICDISSWFQFYFEWDQVYVTKSGHIYRANLSRDNYRHLYYELVEQGIMEPFTGGRFESVPPPSTFPLTTRHLIAPIVVSRNMSHLRNGMTGETVSKSVIESLQALLPPSLHWPTSASSSKEASATNTTFFASEDAQEDLQENEPAVPVVPSLLKPNAATNSAATLSTSIMETTQVVPILLPKENARARKQRQNREYKKRAKALKEMAQAEQLDVASQGSTSKIETAPTAKAPTAKARRPCMSNEAKRLRRREYDKKRNNLRKMEKQQEEAGLSGQPEAKETNARPSDEDTVQTLNGVQIVNFGASTSSAVDTAPSVSLNAKSDANAHSLGDSSSVANSRLKRAAKEHQATPTSSLAYGTRSMVRLSLAREVALEARKPSDPEIEFLYEQPLQVKTKICLRSISDMMAEQSNEDSAMAQLKDKPINDIVLNPVPMESINSKQPRQLKEASTYRSALIENLRHFPRSSKYARTLADINEEEEPIEGEVIQLPTKRLLPSIQTMWSSFKRMKYDNMTTDDKPEQKAASPPLVNEPANEESQPMPQEEIEEVQDVFLENVAGNEADSEPESTSASNPEDNLPGCLPD